MIDQANTFFHTTVFFLMEVYTVVWVLCVILGLCTDIGCGVVLWSVWKGRHYFETVGGRNVQLPIGSLITPRINKRLTPTPPIQLPSIPDSTSLPAVPIKYRYTYDSRDVFFAFGLCSACILSSSLWFIPLSRAVVVAYVASLLVQYGSTLMFAFSSYSRIVRGKPLSLRKSMVYLLDMVVLVVVGTVGFSFFDQGDRTTLIPSRILLHYWFLPSVFLVLVLMFGMYWKIFQVARKTRQLVEIASRTNTTDGGGGGGGLTSTSSHVGLSPHPRLTQVLPQTLASSSSPPAPLPKLRIARRTASLSTMRTLTLAVPPPPSVSPPSSPRSPRSLEAAANAQSDLILAQRWTNALVLAFFLMVCIPTAALAMNPSKVVMHVLFDVAISLHTTSIFLIYIKANKQIYRRVSLGLQTC